MKRVLGLSAAVAGLLISASGSAAVVPVSVIIDIKGPLATLTPDGFSLAARAAALASPIAIKDGDTLQFTINFAGTEAITLTGASTLTTRLQAVSSAGNTPTTAIGSLKLIGPNVVSSQTTTLSQDSASSYVDAETQFSSLPDPTTFTGLYWEGTVDYTSPSADGTTRLFDTPSFTLFADNISISGSAPPSVPEAATWAMMVIGFGAIGVGLRARRSTSVKFA